MQLASVRHVDATYEAINCSDNARRCKMHIASRTAHLVPHAPYRAATLRHIVCLDACILPFGNLATRCVMSAGASCSARCACAAVQHSASRWGCPFGNDSKRVRTRSAPAPCAVHRTPYYTSCRSMPAPHRARHLSAVPQRATYHPTRPDRAVRDRAAPERDGAIVHANHAAQATKNRVLHTAGAAPSADTRPNCASGPNRIAALARTHPSCFGAGYRHGVEQRGALFHFEHAAFVALRRSASR